MERNRSRADLKAPTRTNEAAGDHKTPRQRVGRVRDARRRTTTFENRGAPRASIRPRNDSAARRTPKTETETARRAGCKKPEPPAPHENTEDTAASHETQNASPAPKHSRATPSRTLDAPFRPRASSRAPNTNATHHAYHHEMKQRQRGDTTRAVRRKYAKKPRMVPRSGSRVSDR